MRVAVGQAAARPDISANAAEAARLVHRAADADAELLVLPELFLSGYDPVSVGADPRRWGIRADDSRLHPLVDACRSRAVTAIVGAPVDDGSGRLCNAVLIVEPHGAVELGYAKVHLWAEEAPAFRPGDALRMVRVGDLRVGLGICYDAGFPEFVRAYARAGADLVVFSSAFASGEEEHRYHIYHAARALESGVFVAVSNGLGSTGGQAFIGRSQIFDPRGHCIADAGDTPGIVTCEITPESVSRLRLPYLSDLRDPLPVSLRGSVDANI